MATIAFLATSAQIGGAETSLLALLEGLRARRPGWPLTVVLPDDGPLVRRCRALDVATRLVPMAPALARLGESATARAPGAVPGAGALVAASKAAVSIPAYTRRLERALREIRPTVIHSNGLKMHVLTSIARVPDARIVWHVHEYLSARRATAFLLRRVRSAPAVLVANSVSVARDVRATLGDRGDVKTIYNGVSCQRFTPGGDVFDLDGEGAPRHPAVVRIGLIATFGRWKGHEVFLEALARLSHRDRVHAYIVGDAVYQTTGSQYTRAELEALVAARGLSRMVTFAGAVSDVPAVMRALDIVVHASVQPEPFGMVIAEAMACGRTVVAAKAGGAAELFTDDVDALGHRPGDAADLSRVLDRAIEDPDLRARIGRAARETALARFSAARMTEEFISVYEP